ncbi:hypothetical protein CALCODRAFT_329069 [Calocera cornea HHB12733]|uniref:Restriction of telomere capping protein 4 C-terminal domain-containing protein n=1 Tax=Calocera cornea HHB12733 TaxID=1353952 RepID=A0A165JIM6_9BASI|nr:hypothetical protein CALCODRAFT_329069 [Calocera cornea HHB12733]
MQRDSTIRPNAMSHTISSARVLMSDRFTHLQSGYAAETDRAVLNGGGRLIATNVVAVGLTRLQATDAAEMTDSSEKGDAGTISISDDEGTSEHSSEDRPQIRSNDDGKILNERDDANVIVRRTDTRARTVMSRRTRSRTAVTRSTRPRTAVAYDSAASDGADSDVPRRSRSSSKAKNKVQVFVSDDDGDNNEEEEDDGDENGDGDEKDQDDHEVEDEDEDEEEETDDDDHDGSEYGETDNLPTDEEEEDTSEPGVLLHNPESGLPTAMELDEGTHAHEELAPGSDAELLARILAGAVFSPQDKPWSMMVQAHATEVHSANHPRKWQGPVASAGIVVKTKKGVQYVVNHTLEKERLPRPGKDAHTRKENWIKEIDVDKIKEGLGWAGSKRQLEDVAKHPEKAVLWAKIKGRYIPKTHDGETSSESDEDDNARPKGRIEENKKLFNAGYYGPEGGEIIEGIVKKQLTNKEVKYGCYSPFHKKDFIHLVLVPEAVIILMRLRFQIDEEKAAKLLEKSKQYGEHHFSL